MLKDCELANTAWEKGGARIAPTDPLWIKHRAEQSLWSCAVRTATPLLEDFGTPFAARKATKGLVRESSKRTGTSNGNSTGVKGRLLLQSRSQTADELN
jgi:hypothetical protein